MTNIQSWTLHPDSLRWSQHSSSGSVNAGRNIRRMVTEAKAICIADTADHLLLREALKQALACEELHHDHGKAVDICRPRHLPLLQQLWGHVGSRACATQHLKSHRSLFSAANSAVYGPTWSASH